MRSRTIGFVAALVVVVLAGAGQADAETVLVSVRDDSEIVPADDEDYNAQSRFHLSAVEDGVMSTFFDAGHIVFNLGDYTRDAEGTMQRRYTVRKAAREGGAAFVVQLSVTFERPKPDLLRPTAVNYVLWEVESGEMIAEGARTAPFPESPDGSSEPGSRTARIGRHIGQELLSEW